MAKYRKKPVVIEAFKSGIDKWPDWFSKAIEDGTVKFPDDTGFNTNVYCTIETLEGTHIASVGDYIVRGVEGELYPCKYEIFEMTYDKVPEDK